MQDVNMQYDFYDHCMRQIRAVPLYGRRKIIWSP